MDPGKEIDAKFIFKLIMFTSYLIFESKEYFKQILIKYYLVLIHY